MAYVANVGSGTVTPIRTATSMALAPIRVGAPAKPTQVPAGPVVIAITPDGKIAYVANGASGTVTPISITTGHTRPAIKVGLRPGPIAITP